MPVHFARCCCYFSLRAGSIAIGVAYTVSAVALMAWRILQAVWMLEAPDEKTQGDGVQLVYQALMLLIQAVVSVVLVIGAYTRRHVMVKTWFVYSVSASVLMALVVLLKSALLWAEHGRAADALQLAAKMLAFMGAAIYCFLVVDSFYSELVRARRIRILGA